MEDKILIKHHRPKAYGRQKMLKMFPDYGIWSTIESKMDFNRINNIDELKEAIVVAWDSISQKTVDKMIGTFRKRCRHVILENGGPIQRFNL